MCPPSTAVINHPDRPDVHQMVEKLVHEFSAYCSNPTSKERRHLILNLLYALDETYKMDMIKVGQQHSELRHIFGRPSVEGDPGIERAESEPVGSQAHAGNCMTLNGGDCSCR